MKLTVFGATGGVGTQLVRQAAQEGHDVTVVVRDASKIVVTGIRVVELQLDDLAYALPGGGVRADADGGPGADAAARGTWTGADAPAPTRTQAGTFARSTRTGADDTARRAETGADPAHRAAALLDDALLGADAVLSALGPKSRKGAGIATDGTRAILQAMARTGVRRISVVSAAPIDGPSEHDAAVDRLIAVPLLNRIFRDVYDDLRNMEDVLRNADTTWTSLRPPKLTNGARTGTYRTAIGHAVRSGRFISRADVADALLRSLRDQTFENQAVGIAD